MPTGSPQRAVSWHNSSTIANTTLADEYGDVSSRECLPIIPGLSRKDASKLLQQRLGQFGPSSGSRLFVTPTGRCSFQIATGHTIHVHIRDDCKAVVISTIVHRVGQQSTTNLGNRTNRQSIQGSYSLMAKMMKHNSLLGRRRTSEATGRVVCTHDGTFTFFMGIDISALTGQTLELSLEHTILQAVQMSQDFARCEKSNLQERLQNLLRLRHLAIAYRWDHV